MSYIILFLIAVSIPYLIKRINLETIKKWLGIESPSKNMIYWAAGHGHKDGDNNDS